MTLALFVIEINSDGDDDYSSQPQLIVCFVPQRNETAKVPKPEHDERGEVIVVLGLVVLEGCLSLALRRDHDIQSQDVEVSTMQK